MYDGVKQRHPGAPCALGARVRRLSDGAIGTIAPPRPGITGIHVRIDGVWPPVDVHPRDLEYLTAPVAVLGEGGR